MPGEWRARAPGSRPPHFAAPLAEEGVAPGDGAGDGGLALGDRGVGAVGGEEGLHRRHLLQVPRMQAPGWTLGGGRHGVVCGVVGVIGTGWRRL